MSERKIVVELTQAQARAVITALDATAVAGDLQDALSYYSNPQSVTAARRALEAVSAKLYEKKP